MVNNLSTINKTNNHLSAQTNEHKKNTQVHFSVHMWMNIILGFSFDVVK